MNERATVMYSMRIIYSPRYNIAGYGIEKWHPFDGRKFGRAWDAIVAALPEAKGLLIEPAREVDQVAIARVHAREYLQKLGTAAYLAKVFETPQAAWIPAFVLDKIVLSPMRWATAGTIVAAREALQHRLAINLGGGFHHAKPERGEGFNVYNDVAIAIAQLRAEGTLGQDETVLYVDCDAHQGNGVCHCFRQDRTVQIFDSFNNDIYPAHDRIAQDRIDAPIPLSVSTPGEEYLLQVQRLLPEFLDRVQDQHGPVRLAFYNAGTDVHEDDPLGFLKLTAGHILERDVWVVNQLRSRGIATATVLGGGYTQQGFQLVANSVLALLKHAS